MFPQNLLATFCCIYCPHSLSVLHYIYIKFRARYFHYVSTPMEIHSQDFVSEFHCFFSKEFTQIFDDVTHSPATLSAPALAQVACTPGKCYGTSEFLTNPFCIEFIFIQFLYCLFILTMLKYIQKVFSLHLLREERYGNYQQDN